MKPVSHFHVYAEFSKSFRRVGLVHSPRLHCLCPDLHCLRAETITEHVFEALSSDELHNFARAKEVNAAE